MTELSIGAKVRPALRPSSWWLAGQAVIARIGYITPLLLLIVGLGLRLYGYNFDDGQLIHPDESAIDQAVISLGCCLGRPQTVPSAWPSPFAHFFDPALAPYNPHFFNYGSLPIYLLAFITRVAAKVGELVPGLSSWRHASDLTQTNWIGRWLSALFDTTSVAIVYRIARRTFDPGVGLLALIFSTFSVLEIQLSHFYAVDTLLTCFVLLTLWGAVGIGQENGRRWYLLAGAAFGAALATKTSAFPLIIPMVAGSLLHIWRLRRTTEMTKPAPFRYTALATVLNSGLVRLLIAFGVAIVVFAVCEPYGIIDHPQLVSDMQTQNAVLVTHSIRVPYTIQFAGTAPYLYDLKNLILWYQGPALGIAACLGTLWFTWRNLRKRLDPGQAVLLAWVIPYFLAVGHFWAKFDRYLLPIIPILSIFGAAFLVWMVRRLRRRWRLTARVAIAGVTLSTALWAFAYMNVYATTDSQIAASRWIYSHIRPHTPFATEGAWDRSLPLCLPQPHQCPSGYNSYQLNLYSPDNGAKVNRLVRALTHDDYIIMSTQRFLDSIPREPKVYPITTRYYHLLFHDRLNFRLAKRFVVHPRIGPWVIDDLSADENFTVFDHPDVRTFKRTGSISAARARYLLTHADVSKLRLPLADSPPPAGARLHRTSPGVTAACHVPGRCGSSRQSHTALSRIAMPRPGTQLAQADARAPPPINMTVRHQDSRLMLNRAQWAEDQTAPTYNQMFPPHGLGMSHPVLIWLALVELLGLAAFPLAYFVCRRLSDRGWIVGKTIGLVLTAWLVWVLVSTGLFAYSASNIWIVIGTVVAVGGLLWLIQRKQLLAFLRSQRREILVCEAVFLAAFVLFLLLRMWYPDLGHQFSPVSATNAGSGRMGEKQLELAFLNAISRSRTFPPLDPFFAGGYINYYYFGYVLVASICKATTIAPAVGFNLAIPTFFGLLAATTFSIGRTITRSTIFGLVTVLFTCCIGNLNGLVQVVQGLQSVATVHSSIPFLGGCIEAGDGIIQALFYHRAIPAFDFWQSTRLIPPAGINFAEFPYFTYLFGDLHAHLMAFPMDLAVVAISLSLALSLPDDDNRRIAATIVVAGLILGAIEATNPLDFPTYLAVLAAGLLAGYIGLRRRGGRAYPRSSSGMVRDRAEPLGLTREEARPEPVAIPVLSAHARPSATRTEAFDGSRTYEPAAIDCETAGRVVPFERSHGVHSLVRQVAYSLAWTAAAGVLAFALFPPLIQGYHPVFNTGIATVNSAAGSVRASILASQPRLSGVQLSHAVHDALVTPLQIYWEIFGLFLFVIITWLIGLVRQLNGDLGLPPARSFHRSTPLAMERWNDLHQSSLRRLLSSTGVMMIAGLAIYLLVEDLWLLAFLLILGCLTAYVIYRGLLRLPIPQLWLLGVAFLPIVLSAFCEIFFVRDYLGGGLAFRMNTVAKVYNQIWILFALCASAGLYYVVDWARQRRALPTTLSTAPRVVQDRRDWSGVLRRHKWWSGAFAILLGGSLIYVYSGTISRETYRQTWLPENSVPFTLNGMAFMHAAYPGDFAAINWLNVHVKGTPVIIEADQAGYNWRSRVVQFTGLPTLFGGIYEPAQRYASEIAPRQSVLEEIYGATDSSVSGVTLKQFGVTRCRPGSPAATPCIATQLLRAYHVSYVYVGLMERQLWAQGVRKFAHMRALRRVFHYRDVSIYHVRGAPA